MIKRHGGNPHENGCICLSKKKKNVVISNSIGCAAFYGKTNMLRYLLDNVAGPAKNYEAMEHQDSRVAKGAYVREFNRYTPLMLAIAGGDSNLDCVKALL